MNELYKQIFSGSRIVYVKGWNTKDVILEDVKSGLVYAMSWDNFFKHHEVLEKYETDITVYNGVNLDIDRFK